MFFDLKDLDRIAISANFVIFVLDSVDYPSPDRVFTIQPNEKNLITIDAVRSAIQFANNKTASPQFIYVHHADKLTPSAENAFLKLLEEPDDLTHLVFFTSHPTVLLPTTLSRAQIFFKKITTDLSAPPNFSPEIISLAKQLISSQGADLIKLAQSLTAQKKIDTRAHLLEIVEASIQILYKSFFLTKNPNFLTKLEKFISLHASLLKNGHLKLHLVADLC